MDMGQFGTLAELRGCQHLVFLLLIDGRCGIQDKDYHTDLRCGHCHGEQDSFKHVPYLFRSREGNVDDEVESLLDFVEHIGHGHGEDVSRRLHNVL